MLAFLNITLKICSISLCRKLSEASIDKFDILLRLMKGCKRDENPVSVSLFRERFRNMLDRLVRSAMDSNRDYAPLS